MDNSDQDSDKYSDTDPDTDPDEDQDEDPDEDPNEDSNEDPDEDLDEDQDEDPDEDSDEDQDEDLDEDQDEDPENIPPSDPNSEIVLPKNLVDDQEINSYDYEDKPLETIKLPYNLEFVPRSTWEAKPPEGKWPLKIPIKVIRMTTTTGIPCDTIQRCCKRLRKIQHDQVAFHELADIAYNFMIGADGRIYEGRGWEVEPILVEGEEYLSDKAIAIAFIGNYDKRRPVPPNLEFIADEFIKYGVDEGKINERCIKIEYREIYDGFSVDHIPDMIAKPKKPEYDPDLEPDLEDYEKIYGHL